jgi:2-keto-3-deoxy-L-rhamnonate aldolase RhmA
MSDVLTSAPLEFRRRLLARELLVGTFVKTPHPSVVEVLGHSGLDCVCMDAEHAPFDRATLDTALLAARAAHMPALLRVARPDASDVVSALDMGATGVVIPHVTSAAKAMELSRAARYGPEGRGFSGSTRAAGYTTREMRAIIAEANESVAVIAQIEDQAALEDIDGIASASGIDALFVGVMDLTVSLRASAPSDPAVVKAVYAVIAAARRHSRAVGIFASHADDARHWNREGASLLLVASDQQWILQGARGLRNSMPRT